MLAEESAVPYVWVLAKEELGQASGTKRATSCVLICEAQRKKKAPVEGKPAEKEEGKDWKEGWEELVGEVKSLVSPMSFRPGGADLGRGGWTRGEGSDQERVD